MKKCPIVIRDGLVGLAIGTAVIIPGISAGAIALIFGAFNRLTGAVSGLFKKFWRNLLILLPFGIGAILAIAGLYIPFQLAFEHCLVAIICLFAAFVLGSIPSICLDIKNEKPRALQIVLLVIGFMVAASIGILSVCFDFDTSINNMFADPQWYLFILVFVVGFVASTGLIVPGLSGSLILLVIGFYKPIFDLPSKIVHSENIGISLGLLGLFALGVLIGFVVFSKLMNVMINKHKLSTYYTVIGFLGGSLVSIFVNSNIFNYLSSTEIQAAQNGFLLDKILCPIFILIGLGLSALIFIYQFKKSKGELNAEN